MSDENHALHLEEPRPSLLSSVLVIAGFITLIAIVLWGLLHIATLASPWLSDLVNSKNAPSIVVTAPKEINSGENFTISWKHTKTTDGAYTLLYQCKDNFRLETAGQGATRIIPCGAAVTMASPDNSIQVTPVLSGIATTSVSISIVFIPNTPAAAGSSTGPATKTEQAQGNAIVMVYPHITKTVMPVPVITQPTQTVTVVQPQPTVTTPQVTITPSEPKPQHVTSPADLSVQILGVTVDPSGMGVVEFDIANIGGSSSGSYTFEVFLPTQTGYTYVSPLQSPLGPGSHIVNTLRFSQVAGGTVSIVVDPEHTSRDSNDNNNYASQQIATPYNTYNNGQYPYGY